MRYRPALLLIVLMLLMSGSLWGQETKTAPAPPPDTRAADLLAELSKRLHRQEGHPAVRQHLRGNGKVMEALLAMARQERPPAIPVGKSATVSKVLLLDKALHIFLADDKCALLILTKDDRVIADFTLPELLKLAQEGLGVLFTSKLTEAPRKLT